jgi:hypothetical protein
MGVLLRSLFSPVRRTGVAPGDTLPLQGRSFVEDAFEADRTHSSFLFAVRQLNT